uniref:Uncharacterized protein n=1 Tax=Oryza nivara TaxID=4536 RepID=A0A0E0FZL5_ORYNI
MEHTRGTSMTKLHRRTDDDDGAQARGWAEKGQWAPAAASASASTYVAAPDNDTRARGRAEKGRWPAERRRAPAAASATEAFVRRATTVEDDAAAADKAERRGGDNGRLSPSAAGD